LGEIDHKIKIKKTMETNNFGDGPKSDRYERTKEKSKYSRKNIPPLLHYQTTKGE